MLAGVLQEFDNFEVSEADFSWFADSLRGICGISLGPEKISLLKGRLRPRIRALGLKNLAEYRKWLQSLPAEHSEWQLFVNALTTNKTDWFREPQHFDFLLRSFLPRWRKQRRTHLKVWSMACSTGEEPYTLAILLKQHMQSHESFQIFATDIDSTVLAYAKNGVYLRSRVETQVPQQYLHTSFAPGTGEISDWMKVKSGIRTHVSFGQINLFAVPADWPKDFDVAFCRNVLIYFERDDVSKVIRHIWNHCSPEAMLAVGLSESMQNMNSPWQFIQPSIYLKSSLGRK